MGFTMPDEIKNTGKSVSREFVRFKEGNPILIQFMDDDVTWFRVHTIKTSDIPFLKIKHKEIDCPICSHEEYKEKYWISSRWRANVIDITPEKICPKCNNHYNALKKVPEVCSCGETIADVPVTPRNEVKIIENGKRLFKSFNSIIDMLSATNNEFNLKMTPFIIITEGKGVEMTKTVAARPDLPHEENLDSYDKMDLSISDFTNDEVYQMLNGVPTKEIWKRRRENDTEIDNNHEDNSSGNNLDFGGNLPGLS
jgi:hypothetical protein